MLPEKGVPSAVVWTVRRWCLDCAVDWKRVPKERSKSVVYCILKGVTVSFVSVRHALLGQWGVYFVFVVWCCACSTGVVPCLLSYHSVPPVSCGSVGCRFCQRTRSATITSTSLQLTALASRCSQNVARQVFFGQPFLLLPSAGVQQHDHKPGKPSKPRVIRDFYGHGKLGEFCATSGKIFNKQNCFSLIKYLHNAAGSWA